jgi:xanthine dehydrogenase YagS FAD-binding subunit
LYYLDEGKNGLNIGAAVLVREIEKSVLINAKYPLLSEAASQIGSSQIRNMGTVAGNLCQQVRCWYYRRSPDTGISFDCWRKNENNTCYAANGENQNHSIFVRGQCCAVCPSDLATALTALDSSLNVTGSSGDRIIPIAEFYTARGNVLENHEIIQGITIPQMEAVIKQKFLKFRVRRSIDFATVSVATVLQMKDDLVADARVVLGGVSLVPYRAFEAEKFLTGHPLTEESITKAAEAAISSARALTRNSYKIKITQTLVRRALRDGYL